MHAFYDLYIAELFYKLYIWKLLFMPPGFITQTAQALQKVILKAR